MISEIIILIVHVCFIPNIFSLSICIKVVYSKKNKSLLVELYMCIFIELWHYRYFLGFYELFCCFFRTLVKQGFVKVVVFCFRYPYLYFRHGESASTASQLSKDLNRVPLLLQNLEVNPTPVRLQSYQLLFWGHYPLRCCVPLPIGMTV